MIDTKILEEIGLAPSEIVVYSALLKTGSAKVGVLIKEVSLHRSRVYEAINRLIEKGLVSHVIKNNVKFFQASDPERLLSYVEEQKEKLNQKEADIRKILPELKKKASLMPNAEAHVLYGKEGFKTMRKDVLKQGQDVYLIGGKGKEYVALEYFFPGFDKERIKKKIKFKILTDFGVKDLKENQELKLAELRELPKDYSTPAVINIYGDRVVNVLWQNDIPICFMIINKDIADSYRKWFELIWKVSL
jgi:sugar-specific transcriptional regulator TrmB